jgi:NhaA family Na+:H+ antiporter
MDMAETSDPVRLQVPVDNNVDHFIGDDDAEITVVEYGSYSCVHCHAAHEVIADLRDRFGERMRYVFRQLPIRGSDTARPAADLAEYATEFGKFWPVHDELMNRGPDFKPGELEEVAQMFGLPADGDRDEEGWERARQKVDADRSSARSSGARATPTFFINGRRYEGAWDENALAEAMLGSLGHRIHSATLDFVRWGPSAGLLLLLMSIAAVAAVNSPIGDRFEALWHASFGIRTGEGGLFMPLLEWINHGLLTIFFLVVGLEIKREFTVGHLATRRAAALPVAAAIGGMIIPALIYILVIPAGPLDHGWGVPIATDTAFAIAIIVLLGDRVPVELRVFLTAAVVVDDLVAIAVVAVFYSGEISTLFLVLSIFATAALFLFNRWNVYRPLPYVVVGAVLWFFVHAAGLHATLAGVIIAVLTPTRPPGNLRALNAQAENILLEETKRRGEAVLRHGPSEPALRALDAIHDRIESPANKLLRNLEPWSSYVVLPIFALANAGVLISMDVVRGQGRLMWAIILGLVVGKPVGIIAVAALSVRFGLAEKPGSYTWRQLCGAGALGGIGFTMSLFIAAQAFTEPSAFAAAKIAIFMASIIAAVLGTLILWPKVSEAGERVAVESVAKACTPAG